MLRVPVSELKNKLSAYLRRVRAGETVVVMDRDRPVARIEKVSALEQPDARVGRLEAAGIVRRPTSSLPEGFLSEPLPRARASVLQALLDERAKGR